MIGSRTLRLIALLSLLPSGWALPSFGGVAETSSTAPTLMPVVGEAQRVFIEQGVTLLQTAFDHRVGFDALQRLNPEIDPWIPSAGSLVTLPTRFIVPPVAPEGLVINIPEMRLYDFRSEPFRVSAVAVGDAEDPSPIGRFSVGQKRVDPAWHVPASIRSEKPSLPAVVPPGPDNPLGTRWMTIGATSYGIHGTSTRWSIGRMATHGCVRLYEDEIRRLFERTPKGTPIELIYEPYKWGVQEGQIYFEAHPDLYDRVPDRLARALEVPRALGLLRQIDIEAVWRILEEARGAPECVGRVPAEGVATSTPKS